jgi:hypothetical protein
MTGRAANRGLQRGPPVDAFGVASRSRGSADRRLELMCPQIGGSEMRRWIPRFRIRTLLMGTAFIAILMPFIISQLRRSLSSDEQGVVIMGNASHPDDEDIRALLRRSGQRLPSASPAVYEMKILDYVDPPFRIPLFGKFQRRHRHYECGLVPSANPQSLPPITLKRNELRWVAW